MLQRGVLTTNDSSQTPGDLPLDPGVWVYEDYFYDGGVRTSPWE